MSTPLLVGVGRADITPALDTALMGYPDPYLKRRAERVRDPLHATALAFAQGDKRGVLVELDITILDDATTAAIRAQASRVTDVKPEHMLLCAIQTHSAPRTVEVWGWCDKDMPYINDVLVPGAVQAIVAACKNLQPARIGIGTTTSRTGVNRRKIGVNHGVGLGVSDWAVYDPTMTVLRIDGAQGPLANLVHYGAHPTVYGGSSRVISRDWPGIMIDRMEQLTKVPTLYINGAVGDIAPRTNSRSATGDGEAALWEAGSVAALDAMTCWHSIKDPRDLTLALHSGTFLLPYRPLPSAEETRTELARWQPECEKPGTGMANFKHWQSVERALAQPPRAGKPYLQSILALGPVAFVPVPGEPFGETVLRLRERSPFQHTLVASTSCGHNGYFFTRESLHRGGYETWVNAAMSDYLLVEHIDDVLVDENLRLLENPFAAIYPPLAAAEES